MTGNVNLLPSFAKMKILFVCGKIYQNSVMELLEKFIKYVIFIYNFSIIFVLNSTKLIRVS